MEIDTTDMAVQVYVDANGDSYFDCRLRTGARYFVPCGSPQAPGHRVQPAVYLSLYGEAVERQRVARSRLPLDPEARAWFVTATEQELLEWAFSVMDAPTRVAEVMYLALYYNAHADPPGGEIRPARLAWLARGGQLCFDAREFEGESYYMQPEFNPATRSQSEPLQSAPASAAHRVTRLGGGTED